MTISITCDTCGRDYRLKDEAGGKSMRCKDCRTVMQIPEAGADGNAYGLSDNFDDWGDDTTFDSPPPVRPPSPRIRSSAPTPTKKKRRRKKRRSSGGISIDGGQIVKVVAGIAAAVVGFLAVGGAIRNGGFSFGGYSWQEFQPPGVPVAVLLPGKPKSGTQFQGGMSLTTQNVEFRRPERAFGLMYAPVPAPPGVPLNAQDALDGAREGMVTGIPGVRIISDQNVNIKDDGGNSHPGMEIVASFPYKGRTLRGYYRMALAGRHIVVVMCGALESDADSVEADFRKCLDSFRIVGNIPPAAGGGFGGNVPEVNFGRDPVAGNPPPVNNPPAVQNPPGIPSDDFARRAQEDHERFVRESQQQMNETRRRMEQRQRESRERMEQARQRSQQRIQEMRNRSRNFGRNPGFP